MTVPSDRAAVMADAQRAMMSALLIRGRATADDIRAVVTIPDNIHPSIIGPAVRGLVTEGLIVTDEIRPTGDCNTSGDSPILS